MIPHQRGFRDEERFDMSVAADLEKAGHRVHWGTMLFHATDFYGTNAPTALADLLACSARGRRCVSRSC